MELNSKLEEIIKIQAWWKGSTTRKQYNDLRLKKGQFDPKLVKKFIHLSALGIDIKNNSKYCDSKLKGESAVLSQFPDATILRPSIIFGKNDNFFILIGSSYP